VQTIPAVAAQSRVSMRGPSRHKTAGAGDRIVGSWRRS
jgi:hypothetical protein